MRVQRTEFYADSKDLSDLFAKIDSMDLFHFSEQISLKSEEPKTDSSLARLFRRISAGGSQTVKKSCIYGTNKATSFKWREIHLADGSGSRASLSDLNNPDAVILRIGGEIEPETILMSDIATFGRTEMARKNYNSFKKLLTKETKRISTTGTIVRVMPNCLAKLN